MDQCTIRRINHEKIFRRSHPAAVRAHEEALKHVEAHRPVICRMGRKAWPHRDFYLIWYGIDQGDAVASEMDLERSMRKRIPLAEFLVQAKDYWIID